MKQLTAIFLISVFALSQYAKQFASNSSAKKSTVPQTHFHSVIDEYYSASEPHVTKDIHLLIEKIDFTFSVSVSDGNNFSPDRPPQN
jgi:hypothetical protein